MTMSSPFFASLLASRSASWGSGTMRQGFLAYWASSSGGTARPLLGVVRMSSLAFLPAVAIMFPTAAPMIMMFARVHAKRAERGSTLSVGQKQLLSFARALAFDPAILVLDEATSSVDTDTERLIRDALRVLMAGRTTLAIAHRLSTIQDMDQILVFHHGQLREAGTHQALLAERGIYFRLFQLQYQGG